MCGQQPASVEPPSESVGAAPAVAPEGEATEEITAPLVPEPPVPQGEAPTSPIVTIPSEGPSGSAVGPGEESGPIDEPAVHQGEAPASPVATTLSEGSSGGAVELGEEPGEESGPIEESSVAPESGISHEKAGAWEESIVAELERGLALGEAGSSGLVTDGESEASAGHSSKKGRFAWARALVSRMFVMRSRQNRKKVDTVDLYPCYPGRNQQECEQNPKCFWLTRPGEKPQCVTRHRNQGVGWFGQVYALH